MLVIEVNNGYCRKPFEIDFLPRPTFSSFFVDITNVEPKPDEYWVYDYEEKVFYEPAHSQHEFGSPCFQRQKWNDVRNQRNIFLMESDWTQGPDSPLSWKEKRKWKKYRQELRDIPQKYANDNPLYVHFPPKPFNQIQPTFFQALKLFVKELRKKDN